MINESGLNSVLRANSYTKPLATWPQPFKQYLIIASGVVACKLMGAEAGNLLCRIKSLTLDLPQPDKLYLACLRSVSGSGPGYAH